MEISNVSSAMAAVKSDESSILIAKKVLDAQKLEGRAAVDLIQKSRAGAGGAAGSVIDIYV